MRILHLHDAPHVRGGATAYLRQLTAEMAGRGHRNALYALDQEVPAPPGIERARHYLYKWPGSPLRRRRDFHGFHAPLAEDLRAFAAEFRPDVIHVQNCRPFRTTVFPTLAALDAPVVMTVHDFSLAERGSGFRGSPRAWGRAALDRLALRRARRAVHDAVDRFLCPTQALLDGLGLPPERSRVLHLPIAPREAPPLPGPGLRLFFAGTLFRSKGVDLLLEALAGDPALAAGVRLEIAGEGDQRQPLEEQVRAAGLAERVRFLGHLDAEAMDAAYARANLQVLPSRVPENSPLTVLEAGARGRPSLASHAGGVPELVTPTRGWTFPSEQVPALRARLREIAANPEERARRGQAMRSWVRAGFQPQAHWDGVQHAYDELTR